MLTEDLAVKEAAKSNGKAEKVRGMNASLSTPVAGALSERDPKRVHITRRQVAFALVIAILGAVAAIYTVNSITAGDQSFPAIVTTSKTYDLNFANSGKVTLLSAQVGQRVTAGQVLARQDTTALEDQLAADQGVLRADQAAVAQAQAPQLTVAQRQQDQLQVQQAQTALANAQAGLASSEATGKATVGGAQAAVTSAQQLASSDQARYNQACPGGPPVPAPSLTGTDLQTAQALFTHCQDLQLQLDKDMGALAQAEGQVPLAEAQSQQAINQAQSTVNGAQAALNVAEYQQTLQSSPTDPAQLAQAQANLSQAQGQLTQVQHQIQDATVVAPASGLVSEVYGGVGEFLGPDGVHQYQGPAALPSYQPPSFKIFPQQPAAATGGTTTSGNQPLIEVIGGQQQVMAQVPEAHVSALGVGHKVNVSVGALHTTVSGLVTEVVLNPTRNTTAVTYDVIITLQRPVGGLLPGMSAAVRS